MSVHSRWPLTTGVAQGRYYCRCFFIIVRELTYFDLIAYLLNLMLETEVTLITQIRNSEICKEEKCMNYDHIATKS